MNENEKQYYHNNNERFGAGQYDLTQQKEGSITGFSERNTRKKDGCEI